MVKKIVINPVTRISGFLEISVYIENNKIVDAKSAGMLFRGFEKMFKGRPPLDAIYFTERICGICSTAHSIVSSKALENAFNIPVDENENMIKDILHGSEFLQNHIRHFYQYTLPDFVKGFNVYPVYSVTHNDFRIPEKLSEKLVNDYFESIEFSRKAHEILAILGGKAPHNHGVFAGGVTVNITAQKIVQIKSLLQQICDFVKNVMIEDAYIVGKYYDEYFKNGVGYKNFMSYGLFNNYGKDIFYVDPKVSINNKEENLEPSKISENIYSSWYKSDKVVLKPTDPETDEDLTKPEAYTWIKAPRYEGYAVEVGPLARMYLSGNYTKGISTMDRTIARALEAKKVCEIMNALLDKLIIKPPAPKNFDLPKDAVGKGVNDTTRGALGHWINVKNGKIENYTLITPTAWNLSPKDSKGLRGVIENALIGTYIEDIKNPVEIGRIVRSFDPCVSCATHVLSNNYSSIEIRIV